MFDIAKAFDTVHLPFITDTILALSFPNQFVHWIWTCISTASFSIALNGGLHGFFRSSWGIYQGCSLSPYLYILVSNVLSRMLNQATEMGAFGYHPDCQALSIMHLSFVDDILVFTDGSPSSLQGVLDTFSRFSSMFGLTFSLPKSLIFILGTNAHLAVLRSAASGLGLVIGSLTIH